ncbi:hypothetical protein [Amycolatopsis sp. NPDC051903]|uniref:hypothetical protein n=1 Tax=Amycolatopsis sp. NPDC051903 TaxID=3363936 RepID=UPI0037BC00DD
MSFFTDGPRERPLFPVRERELFGYEGRPWMGPPSDHIVPALLPWTRPLGRSERTIVALRGVEVWPEALTLRLTVYSRDTLEEGRSGSLIDHRRIPDYNALLVGVLYPDGSRASSESISVPSASEPDHPVLRAHGCGGSQFHLDHRVFVWPLPEDGPFTVVVQWLERDVEETHTELDGAAIHAAALGAGELWPGLPKRPGNGVAFRNLSATAGQFGQPGAGEAAGSLPRRAPDDSSSIPHRAPAEGPRRAFADRARNGEAARPSAEAAAPAEPVQETTPTAEGELPASETSLLPRQDPADGATSHRAPPRPLLEGVSLRPRRASEEGTRPPAAGQPASAGHAADGALPNRVAGGKSPLPQRKRADPGRPTFAPAKEQAEDPLLQLSRFAGERVAQPPDEPLPQPSRPAEKPPAAEVTEPLPQPSRGGEGAGPRSSWPVELPQPTRAAKGEPRPKRKGRA